MQVAVSNICTDDLDFFRTLPIDGFETTYGKLDKMKGLDVISVQSLLYNTPDISLFDPPFISHMEKIIRTVAAKGVRHIVFGSPKQRNDAFKNKRLATAVFKMLGDYAHINGVTIGMEHIPECMGSKYLTHVHQVVALCNEARSPGLGLNLDVGNLHKVDPKFTILDEINAGIISHVHISSTNGQPIHKETEIDYELFIDKLKELDYPGWVSLEMLNTSNEDILKSIEFTRSLL